MLEPHSRRLLLDALAPPEGYRFDRAVGTTFTLDLLALLTAPLAFSLIEVSDQEGGRPAVDPLALLEAARRHAGRIAIFTDAGHVAVPKPGQPLLTLLEGSVVPAVAPRPGGLFHPKVWLVRYLADDGPAALRLLCSSRNLTFDRSWDTLLVLDGTVTDAPVPTSEPLAGFVEALPALAVSRPVPRILQDVASLAGDARRARFEAPPGLDLVAFHPMGLSGPRDDPMAGRIDRLLVVSPFVGGPTLSRLAGRRTTGVLVSRAEELIGVEPHDLRGYADIKVLSDVASPEVQDDEVEQQPGDFVPTGLHAKVYVADAGWNARMWVGSANATDQAFAANVEFLVELAGRKRLCGIDALLDEGRRDAPGLGALLDDHVMHPAAAIPDPEVERKRHLLDAARAAVARTPMTAVVEEGAEEGRFGMRMESRPAVRLPIPDEVRVLCRPASLGAGQAVELAAQGQVHGRWSGLTMRELSAFFAVTVEIIASGDVELFTIAVPLEGAPAGRGAAVLSQIIASRRDLLRFLLLLLAADESSVSERLNDLRRLMGLPADEDQHATSGLPLLEPMLQALSRDPTRIDQIARVIEELGATPEGRERLPDRLEDVWPAVLAAREAMRA
jgi:hypothetical protein